MGAAKKIIDKKVLRTFVPINALSATHAEEISRKAVIEDIRSGSYIFKHGDRDYQTVYVLDGKVELVDSKRKVVSTVVAGSDSALHPLAHKQPRQLGARAVGRVTVARIDSSLLDVLLTWDESSGYDVQEIDAQDEGDWMTRMLQSQAFLQLPPSNIHQLLMRLEAVSASAGEVIVRQGEEGDYFYIVKSGRLAVTRKASVRSKDVLLAELGEGACFGEEALVSGTQRNASVRMVTDGSLMRLAKTDFDELLCASLVHETDYQGALTRVEEGAQWLDVRLPGEFENQAIAGSTNIPLSALREQCQALDTGTDYIVCCDTGRRSAAGAFVLSQLGLNVYTLKNGLMDVPDGVLTTTGHPTVAADASYDADIIPFDADSGTPPEHSVNSADSVLIEKLAVLETDKQTLEKQLEELLAEGEAKQEQWQEDAAGLHDDSDSRESELQTQINQLLEGADNKQTLIETWQTRCSVLEAELAGLQQQSTQDANQNSEQQVKFDEFEKHTASLTSELDAERVRYSEAEHRIATLDSQLAGRDRQHQTDIGSTHEAMSRAQNETENLKREQSRLMEKMRKLELNFERERHDHESETHRLHKQLKAVSRESDAGLEAERDALQKKIKTDTRTRDDLEVSLGERSAQVDDFRADIEKLTSQLQHAQASARQAEEQLTETNQLANEEMAVRIEVEAKAQTALRDELAVVIADRNQSQEQFTVQQCELDELRTGLDTANQALAKSDNAATGMKIEFNKLSADRDAAQETYQLQQQELDQLRAETEVTRGLVDMQMPAGEVDASLRDELEQARKNVDVAVRLRSQAEKRVVELEAEVVDLRLHRVEVEAAELPPGHIPSLDDADPAAATVLSEDYPDDDDNNDKGAPAAAVLLADEETSTSVTVDSDDLPTRPAGKKGLLVVVLVAVLAVVGGGWWFLSQSSTQADAVASSPEAAAVPVTASVEKKASAPSSDDSQPVAVKRQPVRTYSEPLSGGGNGPVMVKFQADDFAMGSSSASANFDERPRHQVELSSFAISKHEVTFADYNRFVRASGRRQPGDEGWGRGKRPVINVSWQDARAYVEWLSAQTGSGYRLPTEAEWEFAARAGSESRFWWGNKVGKNNANCFDCGSQWSGVKTAPVASFVANAYAVQDMLGNVMEWVQDCYQNSYVSVPADGGAVSMADCGRYVVRGGGFGSPADSARSASRDSLPGTSRLSHLGFRVVRVH